MQVSERKMIVDYRSPDGPVATKFRSTLLMSGLQALREFGYYDRYVELLPAEYHDKILFSVAPEWVPIEIAIVHYETCDQLQLPDDELDRLGVHVSGRIMGTFLGTLLRSSRNLGTSPWIPLRHYNRLWERILVGGACSVEQVGPKDAIIRSYGIPMLETHYFRTAYQGVIRGAGMIFAKTSFLQTLPPPDGPYSAATQASWV